MRGQRGILACVALAWLACGGGERELYSGRGIVRDVLPDERQVVIEHGDIPGLMPAMTMNFDVPDPALLARLERGQVIDFALARRGRAYLVLGAEVVDTAEVGPEGSAVGLAAAADVAPAFDLVDPEGARVSLASLRGRAVVLDFIFTSCPGPCPILTGLHVSLQQKLPDALQSRTHFVSVSIDPARDTPEALRAYAASRGADPSNWSFLTGSAEEIEPVLAAYGVGKTIQDGEIVHTVATFLIDPEGRIAKRYLGLRHEPETMLRDLREIL